MDVATIVYVKIIQFEHVSRPGSASAAATDIMCEYVKKISQNFNLFLLQNPRKGERKSLNLVRPMKNRKKGVKSQIIMWVS